MIQSFPPPHPGTDSGTGLAQREVGGELSPRPSGLTPEAEQLLGEAIQDKHGTVLSLDTLGGSHVQTNEKDFVVAGDPRSEALWKGAIEELVALGYLRQRDLEGEVFTITNHGYRMGDRVSPR